MQQSIVGSPQSLEAALAANPGQVIHIGSQSQVAISTAVSNEQLLENQKDTAIKMWLESYTFNEISKEIGLSIAKTKDLLREIRGEIAEVLLADRVGLAAERIEGFRDIKRRALFHIKMNPTQAAPLLGVAVRCEENIGKIQGVLVNTTNHLGEIVHTHRKMYDFEDDYPDAGAQVVEGTITPHQPVNVVPPEDLPVEAKDGGYNRGTLPTTLPHLRNGYQSTDEKELWQ